MASRIRHRDLWSTYIAQSITGTKPSRYPKIDDKVANVPDNHSSSDHEIDATEKERIRNVVQRYLPRPPSQTSQAATEILRLCTEFERYPYDLIVQADRTMKDNKVPDEDRLACVVCERMLEIYDTIAEEERHALPQEHSTQGRSQDDLTNLRFSLRRVLVRFCHDSDTFPKPFFVEGIDLSAHTSPSAGGSYGDVYCFESRPDVKFALKTFRVFEKTPKQTNRKALMIEAILLSRLKHRNLVQFLGLYSMRRNKDLDMTYIVSPWMDNGDVVQSMGDLTRRKASIPRIRWIYEVSCGLLYLHDECIVHGDLHAKNILVDNKMNVRITDFGFTSVAELTTTAGITRETTHGFTWYSAPELTEEDAKPNYASDVWSFGCVCLLLWTGEGPYKKFDTTLKLCRALMNNKRTPEDPEHHMDTFYEGQPGEQSRGAILRANVAMPCWEREPGSRVAMKTVRNTLQQKFGPFTRP